jgi:hypothetical protein
MDLTAVGKLRGAGQVGCRFHIVGRDSREPTVEDWDSAMFTMALLWESHAVGLMGYVWDGARESEGLMSWTEAIDTRGRALDLTSELRLTVSLSTLFSWQHQDQHADTAKEASSVTIMQLYRVSI